MLGAFLACLVLLAGWNAEWIVGGVFGAMLVVLLWNAIRQAGRTTALLLQAFAHLDMSCVSNKASQLHQLRT